MVRVFAISNKPFGKKRKVGQRIRTFSTKGELAAAEIRAEARGVNTFSVELVAPKGSKIVRRKKAKRKRRRAEAFLPFF